jgi:hypothetical protein
VLSIYISFKYYIAVMPFPFNWPLILFKLSFSKFKWLCSQIIAKQQVTNCLVAVQDNNDSK